MAGPFDELAALLGERAGLSVEPARDERFVKLAQREMERAGFSEQRAWVEGLRRGLLPLEPLLDQITVGETYFFRDLPHFEFVRREVLRPLRERGRLIRAWSAGCSSGEEAYSLAILFEGEGLGTSSTVLGTDISPAALARAREALYRPWSLRGAGAALAEPWLHREGDALRLAATIRARVTFRLLNLAEAEYPKAATGTEGLDLIFCRNVLIYLQPRVIAGVGERLFRSLSPGGWLIPGPSDPGLASLAPFEAHVTGAGVFYRRPEAAPRRRSPPRLPASKPAEKPAAKPVPTAPAPIRVRAPQAPAPADPLAAARKAFAAGHWLEAAALAEKRPGDPDAAALRIRALANAGDLAAAASVATEAAGRHGLSAEIAFLRALVLEELGRDAEALAAIRSLLYLAPTLAVGHLLHGSLLLRRGDRAGARRAFQRATELCEALPPDEPAQLGDGETVGQVCARASLMLSTTEDAGA